MSRFDEQAEGWDSDPRKVQRAHAVAAAIRKAIQLETNMTALEYGAGTGLLSFELRNEVGKISLADTSEGMLKVLREKIAAAEAQNMQALDLDLTAVTAPPEQFDLIYSLMVLHHIADTGSILRQFHAALRPTGYLCICDLDTEDGSFHSDEFHGHLGFDRDELQGLARQAGFRAIRFSAAYEDPKHGKIYPLFLLTARKAG